MWRKLINFWKFQCRKCVKSEWNCNWCIYDNKCIHNTTCRNTGSVISNENVSFFIFTLSQTVQANCLIVTCLQQCPHFKQSSQEILLPNKVPKEIKLEVENLPRPQSAHTGFLCTVNIEGAHMVLPARIESNKYIVCDKTPVSSSSQSIQVTYN